MKLFFLLAFVFSSSLLASTRYTMAPGSTVILIDGNQKKVITLGSGEEIVISSAPEQKKDCLSAYGKTACGYNCASGYGQVACADDPRGKCLAGYGQLACGFDCQAAYGQVACARTPGGACAAAYGKVTCTD